MGNQCNCFSADDPRSNGSKSTTSIPIKVNFGLVYSVYNTDYVGVICSPYGQQSSASLGYLQSTGTERSLHIYAICSPHRLQFGASLAYLQFARRFSVSFTRWLYIMQPYYYRSEVKLN